MDNSKCRLRIFGDVHGHFEKYIKLTNDVDYSLCVGDMGFDYTPLGVVDPLRHKICAGNHDNYKKKICSVCTDVKYPTPGKCDICQGRGYIYYEQPEHFLGDYGLWQPPGFEPIFFLRGAWSIDRKYRTPEVNWWEDEELTLDVAYKALYFYEEKKPDFVVTHTAPDFLVPQIPFVRLFGPEIHHPRTEQLLQRLYEIHQPKIHIFGHFHQDYECTYKNPVTGKETLFVCLDELSYKDFSV